MAAVREVVGPDLSTRSSQESHLCRKYVHTLVCNLSAPHIQEGLRQQRLL